MIRLRHAVTPSRLAKVHHGDNGWVGTCKDCRHLGQGMRAGPPRGRGQRAHQHPPHSPVQQRRGREGILAVGYG